MAAPSGNADFMTHLVEAVENSHPNAEIARGYFAKTNPSSIEKSPSDVEHLSLISDRRNSFSARNTQFRSSEI